MKKWKRLLSIAGLCALLGAVGLVGCNKEEKEASADLKTAYEVYAEYLIEQGKTPLSYAEWLIKLSQTAQNGTDGKDGVDGEDGKDGTDGVDGEDGTDGKDGVDGEQGVGIKSAYWTDEGELILVLTDGKELNVGKMPPPQHIHTYGEWQDLTATCQVRWQTRICEGCGDTQLQQATPLSHEFRDNFCRYCDASITDIYNGDYGYEYLGTMENGAALQAFYTQIDEAATAFHVDETATAVDGEVATIELSCTLSTDEMASVWKTYIDDHPLYYWLSNRASLSATSFTLLCDETYADGSIRAAQNESLYSKVEEYLDLVKGEESAYNIALAFHDEIIESIDYAYDETGEPSDERWAHTVIGVFEEKGGVCESYARAYQLLLNAMSVENILVDGTAGGELHAWNMVRLEDGEWYYCDLTWDDTPTWTWGLRHNYFCVAETQNVKWQDGDLYSTQTGYFADEHTLATPDNLGTDFLYGLPKAAQTPFTSDKVKLLRQQFTADGYRYSVVGYRRVQFIEGVENEVVIPETVTADGESYTVISVGGAYEDGRFSYYESALGHGINSTVKKVFIPQTVRFLWDKAFHITALQSIEVDEDNPYFTSLDGVLFTKSLYTLILYPNAREGTEYTIPDQTVRLAHRAIKAQASSYGDRYNLKIEKLTFGKGLRAIGMANWGNGYLDAPPTGNIGGNFYAGAMADIVDSLSGKRKIVVAEGNEAFYADDTAIYNKTKSKLFYLFDKEITTYEVPATLTGIDTYRIFNEMPNLRAFTVEEGNTFYFAKDGVLYSRYSSGIINLECAPRAIEGAIEVVDGTQYISFEAFRNCTKLTGVTLPSGLKNIGEYAFGRCESLQRIIIPDSVELIKDSAFSSCYALEEVVLGSGLKTMGETVFNACYNLKSINIPKSMEKMGERVFELCTQATLYCEAEAKPDGWSDSWNYNGGTVVWGYKPE